MEISHLNIRVLKSTRFNSNMGGIEMKGEYVILLGDFNLSIGNDEMGVEGNDDSISH